MGAAVFVMLQVVADVSLQLYFLYFTRTPRMAISKYSSASQPTPYVWLSGALLVALKLTYGLGSAAGAVSYSYAFRRQQTPRVRSVTWPVCWL